MTTYPFWTDQYWLPLMQLYMRKPQGVKSEYARHTIDLAISLHMPPSVLHEQMMLIDSHNTPLTQRLWDRYANNPRRLARDVKRQEQLDGFGNAADFYCGVCSNDSLAKQYMPISDDTKLTPVMLTIILALYFTLTPNTMMADTPEVADTARLLGLKTQEVVEALELFQTFDPILKREPATASTLADEARRTWQTYNNEQPQTLHDTAENLKEYFK